MFHIFIDSVWPCDGDYVGLLVTFLVSTISNILFGDTTVSGVPENHTVSCSIMAILFP